MSLYMTRAGNKPKLITSASESSSLPMGEDTLSKRATNPSKKSNTQAAHTKYAAGTPRSSNKKTMPKHPQIRLQQVRKLGRCRIIGESKKQKKFNDVVRGSF